MFAARYFAPRYFAPRYFAETGADAAPAGYGPTYFEARPVETDDTDPPTYFEARQC